MSEEEKQGIPQSCHSDSSTGQSGINATVTDYQSILLEVCERCQRQCKYV